eukprot:s2759_g19.t1
MPPCRLRSGPAKLSPDQALDDLDVMRASGPSQAARASVAKAPIRPSQASEATSSAEGHEEMQSRRSERHRTFGWVDIEPGLEVQALEPAAVLNESQMHGVLDHGIPERVMLSYLQGEIEGEAAVKNLPAAILLIVWFLMMNLSHELPPTIQSIEKAIDFDITETPGSDGKQILMTLNIGIDHMNIRYQYSITLQIPPNEILDVNTYADWYSWMNLGFSAIYFPSTHAVSEGANFSIGTQTFLEASTYLMHNRKIGGVQLSQQRLFSSECSNPIVANALELECLNFRGLDLRLKPTELDVSQQARHAMVLVDVFWVQLL